MLRRWMRTAGLGVVVLLAWEVYVVVLDISEATLPSPWTLFDYAVNNFAEGTTHPHIFSSLYAVLLGLFIGSFLGILFGYAVAKSRTLELIFEPYIVLAQTVPKIAIAPLLILWFGLGATPKVVLVALVVFFPVMVNAVTSFRSIERDMDQFVRVIGLNWHERLRHIELPFAAPAILAGIRIGTSLAMTAVVIAELMGSSEGLGYRVALGGEAGRVIIVLEAVLLLVILGYLLFQAVALIERRTLRWHQSEQVAR